MKIDIWSDVRCPFCYIGKRKFEAALEHFPHKNEIEIVWRSFQLDPALETRTDMNVYDYFIERKGVGREQAEAIHRQVTQTAKETGLTFNFENAVVANSFNAHRLIQLAKTHSKGNEAEEQLFKDYFTEGKNIDDNEVLVEAGSLIGLEENEIRNMLASTAFTDAVKKDELQAQTIGVRGVPFFVFDDQYAVSGAQSPEVFLQALQQSWNTFAKDTPAPTYTEGETCSTDKNC